MKPRAIRIDDNLWEEIKQTCKKIGCDKSTFVRMAIIEKLQKVNKTFMEMEYGTKKNV